MSKMKKLDNAYDVVKQLIEAKRVRICESELWDYAEKDVIIALLRSKYNATYYPPDYNEAWGTWYFDNPLRSKKSYYAISYCYFGGNKWEEPYCGRSLTTSKNCYDICYDLIRLDLCEKEKDNAELQKQIFDKILKEKIFVGKQRFWKIDIVEDY